MNPLTLAFVFGGVALLFETVLFLTWWATQWMFWERAWLWALGLNVLCLLAGAVCLVRHLREHKPQGQPKRSLVQPGLAALLLLLIFPAGGAYLWATVLTISGYSIEVRNETARALDSFVVSGSPVGHVQLGPVSPHSSTLKRLHLTGDGVLSYSAQHGPTKLEGVLDSSASPTAGEHKLIVLRADGQLEVARGPQP